MENSKTPKLFQEMLENLKTALTIPQAQGRQLSSKNDPTPTLTPKIQVNLYQKLFFFEEHGEKMLCTRNICSLILLFFHLMSIVVGTDF